MHQQFQAFDTYAAAYEEYSAIFSGRKPGVNPTIRLRPDGKWQVGCFVEE